MFALGRAGNRRAIRALIPLRIAGYAPNRRGTYVTPLSMLEGRRAEIHAARGRKLELARQRREHSAETKLIDSNSSSNNHAA